MMQQGVIDGAFLPAVEQRVLRLSEVTDNLTILPQGLYMGSFSMFMDPYVFEDLSEADQAAIDAVSGEFLSIQAGRAWDASDASGIASAREQGVAVKVLKEGDALTKQFETRLKNVPEHWVKMADEKGYNGQEALDYLRKQAHEYADKHGA